MEVLFMALSSITVRVDNETKSQYESICAELGLSSSAAINTFIRAVVRQQGMPFSLNIRQEFSLEERLKKALENIPIYTPKFDREGNIIIDGDTPSSFADWVVNG
jgi:DNA-damage-inducible protein J